MQGFPARKSCRGSSKGFLQGSCLSSSKGFLQRPRQRFHHCIFSKGPSSLIVCPPSQNLTRPSTLSKAGSNQKKRQNGTQSKARSCLHIGSGKVAKQTQQSLCHIFNITNWHNNQSRNINQNRKQHVVQGSSKRSSKVPARIPARFQQGSSRVTSLLEFSLLCFCQQNMTGIFGYDGSVRWGVL